ncbi:MAG: cytochrome c family protein [Bacteroidetes bacterium]|nr:cytochrome c family protein [Bacteroidota bacterium]
MNKIILLIIALTFTVSLNAQEYKYIGSQECKKCHISEKKGSQFVSWLKSRHSHAFWRLNSEWSLFLAHQREKYQDVTEPQKDERCLKCHTSIRDESKELASETYNIEEGVGCEACHGPASVYIKTHMKKDRTTLDDGGLKPDETVCKKCHQDEHFQFIEKLPKIAHGFPKNE